MTATQQQRAVLGRPFIAAFTFGADGDALPDAAGTVPDAVTVTIMNAEGVAIVTGQIATVGDVQTDGTQTATYDLAGAQLPARDLLTAAWTTTINGVAETQYSSIDVCDNRLFPLSDYNQYPEIEARVNAGKITSADLELQRMFAEDFLERECGRAFTGRYGTEVRVLGASGPSYQGWWGSSVGAGYRSRGVGKVVLHRPFVQVLRGITRAWVDNNGNPQTHVISLDWAELDPFSSSVIYHTDRATNQWDGLWGDLTFSYEHGEYLPDVRRICALLARHRLLKGPLDDRATQLSGEGGGVINLLTPGLQGSVTGIAEVDVFIQRYNARSVGFIGVA